MERCGRSHLAWLVAAIIAFVASCTSASSPPTAPSTSAPTTIAPTAFGPGVLRGNIADPEVAEASGLVASRRAPGRLWTHNDSDQPPVIFCLEADGASCGGWSVAGATNVDWEDIAADKYSLYIADIGDNTRSRTGVVIYRVPEPVGDGGTTAPAIAIHLTYDDGPHDAESLLVHPTTGDVYVITKAAGDVGVYRADLEAGVLRRIATARLGLFGLATGGDISPDGRRVAILTAFGAYELTLDADREFDTVWDTPAVPLVVPALGQGEAIAYRLDGNALLVTSEGEAAPLYELPRL